MQLSKRLLKDFIKPHLVKVGIAAGCMIIAAAATASLAWLMRPVIDEIFVQKQEAYILYLTFAVIVISLVKGIASYTHSVIMKIVGQRITIAMQLKLYEHLLRCDIAMFDEQSSGALVSRFSNDIAIIRKNLANVLVGLAKETLTLIFLVGVMFSQSVELSLIAIAAFPLAIYPILKLGRRMRHVSHKTQEELGEFTKQLDDTFQGVRIVKAYGSEQREGKRARSIAESILNLYIKAARIESAASPIMEMLAGIAIAAVIWYGGYQLIDEATTPGAFFSFITALIMAYKPMKSLSGLNTNLQEGLAAVKRFYSVMSMEPRVKDTPHARLLSVKDASLELHEICFNYLPDRPALTNVSIHAPAGKRVALVGSSGAGKSTIMNLILRFYDPDAGTVSIGSTDIRDITLASLREHIALVNQEATLFDDTIRANICYGKPDASDDEMIEAAKAAAAHEFIMEQPQGYDTLIGQHGLRLSGGQRQRIAIARAMLKNAPILLLDEATSSLDTVSEQQVQEALDKLMEGRTTIVIAHRLSTIISADTIYVVEDGQIVESGTHKELMRKKGTYRQLYERQFGKKAA